MCAGGGICRVIYPPGARATGRLPKGKPAVPGNGPAPASRCAAGNGPKKAWPPAGLRGTQSVKDAATATGAPVGFDAGKRIRGRQRLVLPGPLASRVLPAAAAAGPAASAFWGEVAALHDLPGPVQVVFGDRSFNPHAGALGPALRHSGGETGPRTGRKNELLHSCLALGLSGAPLPGPRQIVGCQRKTTEACPAPTPGFAWPTSNECSSSVTSNSFLISSKD